MNEITTRKKSRRVPLAERFEKYIDKTGDCWLWTGAVSNGYGRIKDDYPSRLQLSVHRVVRGRKWTHTGRHGN